MRLNKLIKGLPVELKGAKELVISGICSHSKRVSPGNLFIAKRGSTFDGNLFSREAVAAGAAAVLSDLHDPSLKAAQLICEDVSLMEGEIAARYYDHPSSRLSLAAVTGTNGKTTTAYLIRHLLESSGKPCGLIGTIEYLVGLHSYQAHHTTPDAPALQRMLREMCVKGCKAAVIEASSHGLSQGRLQGTEVEAALFTNLSQDHLDYHSSMEAYFEAKKLLFSSFAKRAAILNADCPWHLRILEDCPLPCITYGVERQADLVASNVRQSGEGSSFDVSWKSEKLSCSSRLIGSFNISNILGAFGTALALGIPLEGAVEALRTFPGVPGRLQRVPNERGLEIYVDFAHTPQALEAVLCTLKGLSKKRLILVFGCGGERDRTKRKEMGRVAERYSDLTILTSDNPRGEDPEAIAEDILEGFSDKSLPIRRLDRREAITTAVQQAKPGDRILIAGKGHEKYQIFSHHTAVFDDAQTAKEACGA